ncbi:MAG: LytTR family DNA-binding domain-containing protein [Flavipsychrobacter sp.]
MINAIIVEDEISLRTLMRKFVHEVDPDINIVSECENINEAQEAITLFNPDIIFLDIILPGGNSFELLERLPNLKSEIIFATAYDKYLLDAFEHAAVGYIMKPIDKKKLKTAINNAKNRIAEKKSNNLNALLDFVKQKTEDANLKSIGIPTHDGVTFINYDTIERCEAYKSCTKIHLNDNSSILSSYNLGKFKEILPNEHFFQIHKSHVVSFTYVKKYNSKESMIEMIDGEVLPLSKSVKKDFISHYKIPKR